MMPGFGSGMGVFGMMPMLLEWLVFLAIGGALVWLVIRLAAGDGGHAQVAPKDSPVRDPRAALRPRRDRWPRVSTAVTHPRVLTPYPAGDISTAPVG
jgi:hypothetical protein